MIVRAREPQSGKSFSSNRSFRRFVLLISIVLPQPAKKGLLRHLLGWTIGHRVRIGLSYLDAEIVEIGNDVYVGHFNLVRNVKTLRIGARTHIKNFNSFFGASSLERHGFASRVEIGCDARIMSHHFADCAGTLVVEDRVTIGGRSTEIYTHQRNIKDDGSAVLEPTSVTIGRDTYVAARCTLVSCLVPPGTVIGAGAVVVGNHEADAEGPVLLAGNPARVRKRYGLPKKGD